MFGDVTSANIVGYQTINQSESGRWLRGATFNGIGLTDGSKSLDGYDIQSIVPAIPAESYDDEGNPTVLKDGEAQIQLIKLNGATQKTLSYFTVGGSFGKTVAGWYERDASSGEWNLSNKKFVRGEGFRYLPPTVFDEDGEDGEELATTYNTAGEVKLAAKTHTLSESGRWQLANYRPVAMDIQKLIPSIPAESYDDEGNPTVLKDGEAQIQLIKLNGATQKTYSYFTVGGSFGKTVAGWYERDASSGSWNLVEKNFAPGEGFLYLPPTVFDEDGEDGEELETYLTFAE